MDTEPVKDSDMVIKLYSHSCSHCDRELSRFPDAKQEEDALELAAANSPIVHHLEKNGKRWDTAFIIINNPIMRRLLAAALSGKADVDMEEDDRRKWRFVPPFKGLVHCWEQLKVICNATNDENRAIANALISFLETELDPYVKVMNEIRQSGMIAYDRVWQIFPPGSLAVIATYGEQGICQVVRSEEFGGNPRDSHWMIHVRRTDWDGEVCGLRTDPIRIDKFRGMRLVTKLPVFPLEYSSESVAAIKSRALERGKKFEALRGCHVQSYDGTMIPIRRGGSGKPVTGRVIIDAAAYCQMTNVVRQDLAPLDSAEIDNLDQLSTSSSSSGVVVDDDDNPRPQRHMGRYMTVNSSAPRTVPVVQPKHGSHGPPPGWMTAPAPGPPPGAPPVFLPRRPIVEEPKFTTTLPGIVRAKPEELETLTEEQRLIAFPWVRGFDLNSKEWGLFHVDKLTEPTWNEQAFDSLVLPGEQKKLVAKFVERKTRSTSGFDDFVQDKGRGVIVLMFGPAGVGKTYTAQAVAERCKVPLYQLSAGMLGTGAQEVERALDQALHLCQQWNALLLIDEADVFLGARTNNDISRNELVAVFLTKLEYYQGMCLLTTNRITDLDHAFRSRVDLFLPYDDLDEGARRQVWENFLNHMGREKFGVTSTDINMLATKALNGRDIKNLVKTAVLLSEGSELVTMETLNGLANSRVESLQRWMNVTEG